MSTVKKYQHRKEDFVCEHCARQVQGSGYTNHCPECLWSKHVDIFPGDRLEDCGGLMRVCEIHKKGDGYVLVHECQKCAHKSRDHFRPHDNAEALVALTVHLSQPQ